MNPFTIRSRDGDYSVEFLDRVEELPKIEDAVYVIDARLMEGIPYAKWMIQRSGLPMQQYPYLQVLHVDERTKTLDGVEGVLNFLSANKANKRTTLVGIGGGIVQDLVAFTAHVYLRGIPYHLVPTTLLAQADSCIGAKAGINLGGYKNQLGCFYAPKKVYVVREFLDTLSDRDIASGYGEILKLSLTDPEPWFNTLRGVQNLRQEALDMVIRSLITKRSIIEEDEHETKGRRVLLNYGHTFGHALEAVTNNAVPHGLAVAWGIDCANFISDVGPHSIREFIDAHLRPHFPPFVVGGYHIVTGKQIVEAMKRDKKASGDSVNLVLMERPGVLKVVPTKLDERLETRVQEYVDAGT